jgi:small membrane protein
MAIKLLLLLSFAGLAVAAARLGPSPRHLAVRRLLGTALLVVSGVAVLFPTLVTDLARALGVGRGTDLVLYVFVVVSAVTWLGMYRRVTELEGRLTRLVRSQALATPEHPPHVPPLDREHLTGVPDAGIGA